MFAPCYTTADLVGPEASSVPGTKTPTPEEYFQAKFTKVSHILAMMKPFKPTQPKDDARVGSPVPEEVGRRVGSPAPTPSDSSPGSPLPISGSPDKNFSGLGAPAPTPSGSDSGPGSALLGYTIK